MSNICTKKVNITTCQHTCTFFTSTMDGMECGHPYFEKCEDSYASMIINNDGKVPEACPLRNADLHVQYVLTI